LLFSRARFHSVRAHSPDETTLSQASAAARVYQSAFATFGTMLLSRLSHVVVPRFGAHVVVLTLSLAGVWATPVHADAPLDGAWTMSAITETYTVQQWSSACGPAPVSGTMQPGGPVTVQTQAGEIVISGGKRTLRSDQCLDPLPTLTREVHSSDGKSWRTRCSSPQSDPRHAIVNAAFFVTGDDDLAVGETGRYEFAVKDSHCIADVQRDATLRRVVVAAPAASQTQPANPVGAAAPAPATPSAPARATVARVDCSFPGDPVRLEVRPSRKLVRLGEEFAFRGRVLDSNGCPTGTPIQWGIASLRFLNASSHSAQPTVDTSGRLSVPSTDFDDATFDVVATAAGRSARSSVQASSAANYEAMLAQSGLDAKGERDEPAVAVLATGSIGASDAHAEDGARHRRAIFIAVVAGLTLLLGALAAVGARRARRARAVERAAEVLHAEKLREHQQLQRQRAEHHAAQTRAHQESVARAQQAAAAMAARAAASGPMFCPSCRREYAPGSTFCPFDSNRLVEVAGHQDILAGPAGGVCPTCKRGFNPGVKVCPHDGDELVPYPLATPPPSPASPRGKICPTCGGRFDGVAAFCGKDGTQLVLLN
jgi:hypothetical protein